MHGVTSICGEIKVPTLVSWRREHLGYLVNRMTAWPGETVFVGLWIVGWMGQLLSG